MAGKLTCRRTLTFSASMALWPAGAAALIASPGRFRRSGTVSCRLAAMLVRG